LLSKLKGFFSSKPLKWKDSSEANIQDRTYRVELISNGFENNFETIKLQLVDQCLLLGTLGLEKLGDEGLGLTGQ
jgi:hypothetical protein